jgi:predicted lipoprotein with Yx(FWY)xxD motif
VQRLALLALAVLLLGAAGASARTSSVAVVKSAVNGKLGTKILVDARGHTLYLFGSDTPTTTTCINDPAYHCSKIWPPLLTTGAPKAGPGVKASLLRTLKRDDGGTQVTYGGHPLYTLKGGSGIAGDAKAGDVNGQGLLGIWWVLSPSGKKIAKKPHA